jgi:hypothetical protein
MTIPPASNAWLLPTEPGSDGDDIAPLEVGSVRGDLVRWTWIQGRHRLLDHAGPLHLVLGTKAVLTVTCFDPDGLGGWARPETLQDVVARLRGLRSPSPIPTRPAVALVAEKPMPHWKEIASPSPSDG